MNKIEFSFGRHATIPGLVPVHARRDGKRIDEDAALQEAENLGSIDYVFFRRFSDGRCSQVAAYVIDNSDQRFDESKLAQVHHSVWLNGVAPLLYVGWPTRVDVLTCARGPDFWKRGRRVYDPIAKIDTNAALRQIAKTSSEISKALLEQRRFSASRLSDGTFWDDPQNAPLAKYEMAAHRRLIDAIVETDKDIGGNSRPVVRRLLLLTVLIKYLEDREVFPQGWFGKFVTGAKSFFDVLQHGNPAILRQTLLALEQKFNGDVFSLPEESAILTRKELKRFAELVEARTIHRQRYLWEQYSFRHLPIEVLSHLYQRFADRGKGAVYTPPFLANLLLDYAMPYRNLKGNEIVLDPTCGSGVFLVGAFRRLVTFWRSQNQWQRPAVNDLKGLLINSIFGIDLQADAVHLSVFSLALAICDALKPNVIWSELKFDKLLNSNLFAGDFFELAPILQKRLELKHRTGCDVVVGNPPFLSHLTAAAEAANKASSGIRGDLPDKQMAYLIIEHGINLLREGGRLCLIQPAGLLYNEKAHLFRSSIIANNLTTDVLDFTSVRRLFDGADPKAIAIVAERSKPKPHHCIRHLTFRRTFSVHARLGFELDHYDNQQVGQGDAESKPWVWRVNLLGGGRLHQFTQRLSQLPTLADHVTAMGWEYGEGFISAKTGRRDPAPWLTGKPFLPTTALTSKGINESKISVVRDKLFRSAYTEARFSAPLMLIKANERLSSAFWRKGFLAYRAKIIGIHAATSTEKLKSFYEAFSRNNDVLRAFCVLLGSQALVGKATAILKRDIDVLPSPAEEGSWDLCPWERVLCHDIIEYMCEFVRRGQNSKLLTRKASPEVVEQYANQLRTLLFSIYKSIRILPAIVNDGLIHQAFSFGNAGAPGWPEDWNSKLRELVYVEHGASFRTVRVLRYYHENIMIIVKPDRLRYWTKSVAIRDADETLVDLRNQGY